MQITVNELLNDEAAFELNQFASAIGQTIVIQKPSGSTFVGLLKGISYIKTENGNSLTIYTNIETYHTEGDEIISIHKNVE